MGDPPRRYEIPTFLGRADRGMFGLSLAQLPAVVLSGFLLLALASATPLPDAGRVAAWALSMAACLLVIVARPWGRSLAAWALVARAYRRGPRVARWQVPESPS